MNIGDKLLCAVPVVLTIPNIYICMLGHGDLPYAMMTVLLPLGTYLLIMSAFRNTPKASLFLFPVMLLGAFQIVVSFLYNDDSAIGIDMFLNVGTTNFQEAGELLASLSGPIVFVVFLYLPVPVFSLMAIRRRAYASGIMRKRMREVGVVSLVAGCVGGVFYVGKGSSCKAATSEIFPINAILNLSKAVVHHHKTARYAETSGKFTYNAHSLRKSGPELYIAVIGETSRADNWRLTGYSRQTNPLLSRHDSSLIVFDKVFSESNTTHKSVPMLLTTLSAENFDEGIYEHKSVITAFKEAGFRTAFISTQKRNNSFVERYAEEADTVRFLSDRNERISPDSDVIPYVRSLVGSSDRVGLLIVVHLYGSHYNYRDRYPAERAVFKPDDYGQAKPENREYLVNAYDNTIIHTDSILHELCDITEKSGRKGCLIYCSDHGEDLFDDARRKFLHASPKPTYWQLHVPFLLFVNSEYDRTYPEVGINARGNRGHFVSSSRSFSQTLLQVAGIDTDYTVHSQSLVDNGYIPSGRLLFLNDGNEAVNLRICGFNDTDRINYLDLIKR